MNAPLVSIICLCYNHASFLREALDSVAAQTYPNLEVLVVDDASTDGSVAIIEEYVARHPHWRFQRPTQNQGNCAAFNQAFLLSKGQFIIDFATDDVLHPERVAAQVAAFAQLPATYGVVYSDAGLIDETSAFVRNFYRRDAAGQLHPVPAQGDVFAPVLARYFICPPTMMVRREVLQELNGYDPALAYEDFDFWVRSARTWKYAFIDRVLCQRRLHAASLSQQVYKPGDRQLASTIEVIKKARKLIRTEPERTALLQRILYEARHAYFTAHYDAAQTLLQLYAQEKGTGLEAKALAWLTKNRVPLQFLRRWYHGWRYRHTSA